MMWTPIAKLHWECKPIADIACEVQIIDGEARHMVICTESGRIFNEGKSDHPIEAMKLARHYVDYIVDMGNLGAPSGEAIKI